MVKAGITYIVDARQKVSARANKVKGKGFEHSAYYSNCKIIFMNIPNIHKVRTSYEGLKNITTRDDFFLQLHNSKWLLYIRSILIAAKLVADFVVFQKKNCACALFGRLGQDFSNHFIGPVADRPFLSNFSWISSIDL